MGKTYKSRAHSIATTCRGEISYQPISIRRIVGVLEDGARRPPSYFEGTCVLLRELVFNHWLQRISALLCLLLGIESKRIESVLGANYYSTSQEITAVLRWGLLQYLAEITAVLGADYCSTWCKYWFRKTKVILRIEEYSSFYR